ncbi:hypothetical protein A2U01_0086635, partial [Trifolium medium]|nr:hypothetical protein [Trifolium medium]
QRNGDSCVGVGSEASMAKSYHAPPDEGFSDAGISVYGRDDDFRSGQKDDGTSLNNLADLGERDKSQLSTFGDLPGQ